MAPNNTQERMGFSLDQLVALCGRQQVEAAKERTEYNQAIGTYKSAITPLLVLTLSIVCGSWGTKDIPRDKRVDGMFLMDSPNFVMAICYLYVLASMVWGPQFMKNRKPLTLKKPMLIYNAFQVALSFYMFIEGGLSGWFFDYNFRCQPCNYSPHGKDMRMVKVGHLFFLSKIIDFIDTAVFIARGKLNQVSNLHVIHHSCMVISMFTGVSHMAGGHITFMGFVNAFVHTVMYTYYLLAGLGPKVRPYLWWKKYLTKMQLTQFVMVFLHAAQLLVYPCPGIPNEMVLWTLLYAFIFFVLFINFYIQAYLFNNKKKTEVSKPQENGVKVSPKSSSLNYGVSAGKSTRTIADVMESKPVQRIQANLSMAT